MAEKNIILHWSRVYHEIFQNSIFLAYVPKKNILLAPGAYVVFFHLYLFMNLILYLIFFLIIFVYEQIINRQE